MARSFNSDFPRILAHRGLAVGALENTAGAFRAALNARADSIETDVHVSSDGVPVLWHDPDLRLFDGSHDLIAEHTWASLKRRRVGDERLISLADALHVFSEARFNIDLKVDAAVDAVVKVITEADATERVLLTSFSNRRRLAVAALLPGVATSPGMAAVIRCAVAQFLPGPVRRSAWRRALSGAVAIQVPPAHFGVPIVTRRFVRAAHDVGIEVHVWTINSPAQMRHLLSIGVDGLVTDRTDIAVAVRAGEVVHSQSRFADAPTG